MAVKTFTTGEVLTAADTNTYLNNGGLVYIAETSFSNTTTPFINGCFSSTYDNYRVLLIARSTSTQDFRMRLRYSTNTVENGAVYDRFGFTATGTFNAANSADLTSAIVGTVVNSTQSFSVVAMDVFNPNVANVDTNIVVQGWSSQTGGLYFFNHRVETTRQYTGLEMTADSGNLWGNIRVYGYRQA